MEHFDNCTIRPIVWGGSPQMELTSTTWLMYMHGHPKSSVISATNVYKNNRLDTNEEWVGTKCILDAWYIRYIHC